MVPGAGCARMCTRRRPVCCVCSGTVCSIVLGCPFRFYCRAAHSAADGDRSGATTASTLCLAAPLAAARPTRIQRPRRRHRRDAARYDHVRGSASPGLTFSLVGVASGDASQRKHSCAARTQRRRAPIGDAVWPRGTRRLCSAGCTRGESKPERAAAGLCPCVSTMHRVLLWCARYHVLARFAMRSVSPRIERVR